MTAPASLDRLLRQLGEVRERCPELRFGQLIAIVGELARDETGHTLWDVEDTDSAAALRRFAQDMARRASDRAEPGAAPEISGLASSPGSAAPEPPRG